jgi:hypothetical protein
MGAENDAFWQTDHEGGVVKAYCCVASNARDFARFGKTLQTARKMEWQATHRQCVSSLNRLRQDLLILRSMATVGGLSDYKKQEDISICVGI